MSTRDELHSIWTGLYPEGDERFDRFWTWLEETKQEHFSDGATGPSDWFRDAVVYSTYVDLFAGDFGGMIERLDSLVDLGVTAIWLLPILDSPMRDQGFDVRDYTIIRPELLGGDEKAFERFVAAAHERDIRIIFDMPLNHCSDEHPLFLEARSDRKSPTRDFFIWADDDEGFPKARHLFKGLVDSNWEFDGKTEQYWFHRFYPFQPDLNFANPEVLALTTSILVHWKIRGVDGFRLDAIPFLWKEKGTDCENLRPTHAIVRFWRKALDHLRPDGLLLAEACQPPKLVVEYFGRGDECHGAYHFPLMPRIFRALAERRGDAIREALDPTVTPAIPDGCQWFTFLRCHDEFTLEMVSPEERRELYAHYCRDRRWDFREGEGISARLATLLKGNPARILQAFNLMLSLPGTPVIYYGDEYAGENDEASFREMSEKTGYPDSRFFVRGPLPWDAVDRHLADPHSKPYRVYHGLRDLIAMRREHPAFGRGELIWHHGDTELAERGLFAYHRAHGDEEILVVHNLSKEAIELAPEKDLAMESDRRDLLTDRVVRAEEAVVLPPYASWWLAR